MIFNRRKIIIVSAICVLLICVYAYWHSVRFKADSATVTTEPTIVCTGQVFWSDQTPAKGVVITVANRDTIVDTDGSYTSYVSLSDFADGIIDNGASSATILFHNADSTEGYNIKDQFESPSLPKPQSSGTSFLVRDFVLEKPILPNNFVLSTGSPTVSNKTATFKFTFVNPTTVTINIVGLNGRTVRTITQAFASGTSGTVLWDGKDNSGRPAANGTYRATITGDDKLNPATTLPIISINLK